MRGMTEMSPLGTICSFKPEVMDLPKGRVDIQETTGHLPFSVKLRITEMTKMNCHGMEKHLGSYGLKGLQL